MISVHQAILHSEELAKFNMGACVSIGLDYQMLEQAHSLGHEPDVGMLTTETIDTLGKRPEVKYYDYSLDTQLYSHQFKVYQPTFNDSENLTSATTYSESFTIRGIHYAKILPIEEGKVSLVDGRTFTETEIEDGSLVAVISTELADVNNLDIGDTLVLSNEIRDYPLADQSQSTESTDLANSAVTVIDSRNIALEIIGIFSIKSTGSMSSGGISQNLNSDTEDLSTLYNTVYVPIRVASEEDRYIQNGYASLIENNYDTPAISSYLPTYAPLFILNSIDDLKSFTQTAEDVMPASYTVFSADSQFDQIAGSMNNIKNTIAIALTATIIASLIIISFVTVLFLRDRLKEFGVYLALGMRKITVIWQVLAEVLIVAILALSVSLFTGSLISGSLTQQLFIDQLTTQQLGQSFMDGTIIPGDASFLLNYMSYSDIINSYHITLNLPYVLAYLASSLSIVALSCIAPMIYILRLKPKRILM
jgi:putative ABC transport system permease protein